MTWFDLINNTICIGFVVVFMGIPVLGALGGPRPGDYVEREWTIAACAPRNGATPCEEAATQPWTQKKKPVRRQRRVG